MDKNMNKLKIHFYHEQIIITPPPVTLNFFKERISLSFKLEASDVDELLIFYQSNDNDKILISSDVDYILALEQNKERGLDNYTLDLYLEVSENSRLYLENSKFTKINMSSMNFLQSCLDDTLTKQEKLRQEIMEKEKLLKDLLEKERIHREIKEKEKIGREKLERDRLEIEKLREAITKTVNDIINSNMEKVKEDLINKTILETNLAVEKVVNESLHNSEVSLINSSNDIRSSNVYYKLPTNMLNSNVSQSRVNSMISKNQSDFSTHDGIKCDGCGMFPIVGIRYKCTKCSDFDFCEECEENYVGSGEHLHPFIKYRESKSRCNKKNKKNNYEEKGISIVNYLKERFQGLKDFFYQKQENIEKPVLVFSNDNLKECKENLKKPFNSPKMKNNEKNTSESINNYKKQIQDLKENFYLGDLKDDVILFALEKANGDIDEAFTLLISN